MKIDNQSYKILTFFILFLIALSTIISFLVSATLNFFKITIPFYVELPVSTPAVFYILFDLFNKKLWKLRIFKKLGVINFDDLNGQWIGFIKTSWDKFETEIPVSVNIYQNATSIKISSKFNESKSISVHENFIFSELDQSTALFYFFRNEPNPDSVETMSIHEGAAKLIYNNKLDSLEGYYYSGRDRNNHGTINLKRKQIS